MKLTAQMIAEAIADQGVYIDKGRLFDDVCVDGYIDLEAVAGILNEELAK